MSDLHLGILRRDFLKSVGLTMGGLALGLFETDVWGGDPTSGAQGPSLNPNVYVHIASDGKVTIVNHRSEMGQGVRSSLPVLIADEMGADMKYVTINQADGDEIYGDQNTDGSSSVRSIYAKMRMVGATGRVMLTEAAAKRWKVPVDSCDARDHFIIHKPTKRRLAFGDLVAEAAKLSVPKAETIPLRPKSELRHVGQKLPLLEAPEIVAGRLVFGADVKLAGMLIAMVARPPVVGGKVARFDGSKALAIPGVKKVFELPVPALPWAFQPMGGIAVVADNTWAANRGREALEVTWENGPNGTYDSKQYRERLLATVRAPAKVCRERGDVDSALAKAAKRLSAEYLVPHLAHATMEPPVTLAHFSGGKCQVWSATQNPQATRKEIARVLGIGLSKVTVHVTFLGGGFSRKSKPDYSAEAALISREVGAPVRVQWTREDDLQHDYYHTTSAQRLEAGLDEKGKVIAWLHRTAFPSISALFAKGVDHAAEGELQQGVTDYPLAIPNLRAENGEALAHVRVGWLRSVCNIQHAFAIGSFLDEIAHARGKDPRESLLEILGEKRNITLKDLGVKKLPNYGATLEEHPIDIGRYRHVVERVTKLSDWAKRKSHGRSLGLAVHRSFLTYVAVVMSAKHNASGKIRIDEAWIVADAGTVINPDRAISQMEGSVIFGMSLALHGAITMSKGAVEQTNFNNYPVVRMGEAPRKIHAEIIKSDGPPGGIGEPGLPPVAPALANAVFALTGKRVRELPLAKAGLV